MANKSTGLSIAHINVRGLAKKVDELKLHVIKHHLKILHISETFLTSNLNSDMLCIPDFNIVRRDRALKHGGGVLTYLHSTLHHSVLSNLDNILPESLTIQISQPSAKPFITSVIYRPPNSPTKWLDQFALYITKCKEICDEVIILGDFNINLNVVNKKWTDLVNQLGLLQLIQHSTRIQAHSQSLIDHIYVTKPANILRHAISDIGLSDHCMVYTTRKLGAQVQTSKPRTKITYNDWKNFSSTCFQKDLKLASWNDVYRTNSAERMLDVFTDKLQFILSKHLKQKTRFVKLDYLPPWLDREVQLSIQKRDSFKKNQNWTEYKRQRNFTTNLIRKKKKQYVSKLVSQSDNKQTKQLWNVLRNTQKSLTIPNISHSSTEPCNTSPLDASNSLNQHFVNIANSQNSSPASTPAPTSRSPTPNFPETHNIPNITMTEVILLFKSIDLKKATGHDNLSVRILRLALPFVSHIITDILNKAIEEGIFPSQWKIALVTPLHKGGDPNTLSNYRPISVLPVLSKIYEKHILASLQTHLDTHNIISSSQSGFRKQHSCTTAMHHLYSTWLDEVKSSKLLVLLFLDFSKAFDMVNHETLLKKLKHMGITGNLLEILQSFLSNRHQCVKIKECCSNMLPLSSGVPQGSILAPTLFQIYINDLLSLPQHCQVHAYADDTTFFISSNNSQLLQKQLDHDLLLIEQWCTINKMPLNLYKSHYLVINSTKVCPIHINICGHSLERKTSSKLLGFTINDSLDWKSHIAHVSNKVSSNLRLFYNLRHLLNFQTSKQYYYNFIHPYLMYGVHLYYPMSPARYTNPLYILQKKALRLICGNQSHQTKLNTLSTKLITDKTSTLPLPTLSLYFTCLSGFQINNHLCPAYLTKAYSQSLKSHVTRNQHKLPSSSNHNRLNLHILKSFNTLPKNLRLLSLNSFKHSLKTYLFSQLT